MFSKNIKKKKESEADKILKLDLWTTQDDIYTDSLLLVNELSLYL